HDATPMLAGLTGSGRMPLEINALVVAGSVCRAVASPFSFTVLVLLAPAVVGASTAATATRAAAAVTSLLAFVVMDMNISLCRWSRLPRVSGLSRVCGRQGNGNPRGCQMSVHGVCILA